MKETTKNILLTDRDINALLEVSRHKMITSMQLAKLCYSDISYETSRKRLRRLHKADILATSSLNDSHSRGRPDLIYYLTEFGKKHIEPYVVSKKIINYGLKNVYQRDVFLKIVEVRLNLVNACQKNLISNLKFYDFKEFIFLNPEFDTKYKFICDAICTFSDKNSNDFFVAIKYDTKSLQLQKHYIPIFEYTLKHNLMTWIICSNWERINSLITDFFSQLNISEKNTDRILMSTISEFREKELKQSIFKKLNGELTSLKYLKSIKV